MKKYKFAGLLTFRIGLLAFFATLALFSCSKKDKASDESGISGKYVNQTFLETISDSIPGLVPAYCYEINFISPDSASVLYGFEESVLAYRKDGKDYVFVKAMQDKDMVFRINEDQTITLTDSGWNNNGKNSVFKKSLNASGKKWDFQSYLNQQMIAGNYTLYKNEKPTAEKLTFKPDGSVSGIPGYDHYTVCYSGDCVEEIYPISNSLTLTNAKNESVTYAFVKSKKDKSLKIHNIEAPVKDMKGERAIKEMVFDLRMAN